MIDIQIPKEICFHRDQNLNENHETIQSISILRILNGFDEAIQDKFS